MAERVLYQSKQGGHIFTVYPDRIYIRKGGGCLFGAPEEHTVLAGQVASVSEIKTLHTNEIIIETTGGEKYQVLVEDSGAAIDAVLRIKGS